MLGDEMIFILTTDQEDRPNVRIVVTDDTVSVRRMHEMDGEDYDVDCTDTKLGRLLLKLMSPKVKIE